MNMRIALAGLVAAVVADSPKANLTVKQRRLISLPMIVALLVMAASAADAGGRIPVVVIVPGHPSGAAYCVAGESCDAVPDLKSHAKRNALLWAGAIVLAVSLGSAYAVKRHIDSRD